MRVWTGVLAALTAALLSPAGARAEKLPSAYDGVRDGFLPNGKQNMPFKLYGVAIQWHLDCLKGKTAQCLRLAAAFEKGAGDIRPDMRVAIAYFLKSCELGLGGACARASTILRDGSAGFTNEALARAQGDRGCTVLKDQSACAALAGALAPGDSRAAALADNACASGADEGCRIKAWTLFYERKDSASRAEAVPMFEKACTAKRAWGCLGLADAHGEGWGVAQDKAKAADYARIGCTQAQGDRLRLCTLHGSDLARAVDDKAALNRGEAFLDASCRGGDGAACLRIGMIGLNRLSNATTTRGEGLFYLRRGCDQQNGEACESLGSAYAGGLTAKADMAVALALFDKACRLGRNASCDQARKLLASDSGLRARIPSIDPALPVSDQLRLAKAAAEGGGSDRMVGVNAAVRLMQEENEDASWLLGGWLKYGLPGIFDTSRQQDALILFENAAKVGHVDAAIYMGMAYWYGDGVAADRAKGENYMLIAAERGNAMAAAIYRSMKLEPERQAAARRAEEFAETARRMREAWQNSWSNYRPSWSPSTSSSSSFSSASSGPSVQSIIDNSNWNQRINYLSGSTTACPRSNPYC
jgi:TPR repeat protein